MTFGARARIRLGAIRDNLDTIKSRSPGTRVMAVVKANAYGHGLCQVSAALSRADCLAVARLAEARSLRDAGIDSEIAWLGGALDAADIDDALLLDLQLAVHDEAQVRWLAAHGGPFPVLWLKVDTGMNRLGIRPGAAAAVLEQLRAMCGDVRLMTHFANADDPADPTTRGQLEKFLPLLAGFDGDVSVANSAGLLAWRETLDTLSSARAGGRVWIRPGLSIYGVSPFADKTGAELGLRPAMLLESRLMSVKKLPAGERVGYGGTWQATADTVLGVVAAGYGDGYSRYIPSGTPVLVNGRRAPVIGRISMDMTAVDLGPDTSDKVGDRVTLWGDGLPVEEVAELAGTIPYQLLTGVTHREPPVYEEL